MKQAMLLLASVSSLWMTFFPAAIAESINATATIQPSEISIGETSQLSIVVEGSMNVPQPHMPVMDGLEIISNGQSSKFQIINGSMTGGTTYMFAVTAHKEGTFKIPEISITVGNSTIKTAPLALKVGKTKRPYSVPTAPAPAVGTVVPNVPSPAAVPSEISTDGFVQVIHPNRDFYVGELVPTDVKIYTRQGLPIQQATPPTLLSTAFTMGKLTNSVERTAEMVRGIPYDVFTWHTAISAVKAGEASLKIRFDYVKMVFSDDMIERFLGRGRSQSAAIQSPDITMRVLPLPTEGRPLNFSSAVGRFEIGATLPPQEVMVGDPTTLTLTVTGTGNFDRVQDLELGKNQGFKTYKPNVRFEPSNDAGYMGQKIFEQVIIPQNAEIKEIPPVSWSFFDPEAHQYVTLSTEIIPIQVLPGREGSAALEPVPIPPISTMREMSTGAAELVPNKLDFGSRRFLTSVVSSPWFWGSQSLPLAALMIAWGMTRRRERLATDLNFAREVSANRAVRAHIVAMDSALQANDPMSFFAAAKRAVQERLAQANGGKAETITLSEASVRLMVARGDAPNWM